METTCFSSPVGMLRITGSINGIRSVTFEDNVQESNAHPPVLMECVRQLDEYFKGERFQFTLPLDAEGTEFQKRVWEQLAKIPYGETLSYLELSQRIGNPEAIRAVGHANGQNKLNILIPCHRVIGSNGALTGYGGGLWRKKWLLQHEAGKRIMGLFQNI